MTDAKTPRGAVVFDTDCVLCSTWVHFILRHEVDKSLRFVSAWSDEGRSLAGQHGLSPEDLDRTYLLIEDGKGLTHSDAGIAIAGHLKWPWRALQVFRFVPRILRDAVYNLVARNRYAWFGHRANCFIPPAGQGHRFVNGTRLGPEGPAQL